jgi:hypothetical protein
MATIGIRDDREIDVHSPGEVPCTDVNLVVLGAAQLAGSRRALGRANQVQQGVRVVGL